MRVLATYSIKGGVGKTATAVNLAHLAAASGGRTLVWDLDPQGAATYCFRVKAKVKGGGKKLLRRQERLERRIRGTDFADLDLLPADFSYRHLDLVLDASEHGSGSLAERIHPLEQRYDWVFLDCPPSISLVSEAVFAAADALLVPTVPTTLSLRAVKRLGRHLDRSGAQELHRRLSAAAEESGFAFFRAEIPYASAVEQMSVRRAPLATFARASAAARAYSDLWAEIVSRLTTGGDEP
jgi:cellulose biosynthesis protein BcsQ